MGMDVRGKKPSAPEGEYFRVNVWHWHPLWSYCCGVGPSVIDAELASGGHYNDGAGLDAEDSVKLAALLEAELERGATEEYAVQRKSELAELPDHLCEFCGGTGIRTDSIGQINGMTTRLLTQDQRVRLGRNTGWCNACDGDGAIPDPVTMGSFEVSTVRDFAKFLRACGGFSID